MITKRFKKKILFFQSIFHNKYYANRSSKKINSDDILLKKCDIKDYNGNFGEEFADLEIHQSFCPNDTSQPIKGADTVSIAYGKDLSYYSIDFIISNANYTYEDVVSMRNFFYNHKVTAQILYTDISYDPFNFHEPVQSVLNVYNIDLNYNNFKTVTLYYQYSNFFP